jgi:hypothetical protein
MRSSANSVTVCVLRFFAGSSQVSPALFLPAGLRLLPQFARYHWLLHLRAQHQALAGLSGQLHKRLHIYFLYLRLTCEL